MEDVVETHDVSMAQRPQKARLPNRRERQAFLTLEFDLLQGNDGPIQSGKQMWIE